SSGAPSTPPCIYFFTPPLPPLTLDEAHPLMSHLPPNRPTRGLKQNRLISLLNFSSFYSGELPLMSAKPTAVKIVSTPRSSIRHAIRVLLASRNNPHHLSRT